MQYLAIEVKADLYDRVLRTVAAAQGGESTRQTDEDFSEILVELVESAVETYFHQPMQMVRMSKRVRASANAGIAAVIKTAKLLIRRLFQSMPRSNLATVANYIEGMLVQKHEQFYVAFPMTEKLSTQSKEVIDKIKTDKNTENYNKLIAMTLIALIDIGVENYYSNPLDLVDLRPYTRRTADMGMSTIQKSLHIVVHALFKRTRQKELLILAATIENAIITIE